jgi:hypothetical protein
MKHTFHVIVLSSHVDWQVSSITQIVNALGPVISAVEHLTLPIWEHSRVPEGHNEVDRTQWRRLLGSFSNVKTLRVGDGFERELSHFLTIGRWRITHGAVSGIERALRPSK